MTSAVVPYAAEISEKEIHSRIEMAKKIFHDKK